MIVPLIMADLVDVGVAAGDKNYIYMKGIQMVICAAIALVSESEVQGFPRLQDRDWGRNFGRRNMKNCRDTPLPTLTISGYPHWSPA